MKTVFFMSTNNSGDFGSDKEIKRLIDNPESLIMSAGLEDILSTDFDHNSEKTEEACFISIDGNKFPVTLTHLERYPHGIEVVFFIEKVNAVDFIDNKDALFTLSDRVFSAEVISLKTQGEKQMTICIKGV